MNFTRTTNARARHRNTAGISRETIDVEEVVIWAYRDQKVAGQPLTMGGPGGGEDSVVRVARRAYLGVAIDCSAGVSGFSVHPDAEAVASAVADVGGFAAALLRQHGTVGTRPEWYPAGVTWRPVYSDRAKGKVEKIYDRNRNLIGCAVAPTIWPEQLALARKVYGYWWRGLVELRVRLSFERLRRWEVIGPGCASAPWEEGA